MRLILIHSHLQKLEWLMVDEVDEVYKVDEVDIHSPTFAET